jgi:tRNA A-37 threonylcarbamoyl transferase component Bud32
MSTCPTPEKLRELRDERMERAEQDALLAHIDSCMPCLAALAELALGSARTLLGLLQQPNPRTLPEALDRLRERPPPLPEPPATRGEERGPFAGPPGYEILEELGRGGMGVVFKARQLKADWTVALKMILPGKLDRESVARFYREARATAQVRHPHVAQLYEVGEHDGQPFFSMEYCPGGNLARKLAGNPLPPREAAEVVLRLAQGVEAAHQQGVIHRDLKPLNVLLVAEGTTVTAKITDFGLARKLDEAGQTHTGAIFGTPAYMAPEQARGRGHEAGPPADIWALGAILYECLTGRPPFLAVTDFETLLQVINHEPAGVRRLNPAVPSDLETICLKCLRKDPDRRYSSASALAEDLGRFLRGEPIQARPTGLLERVVRWCRRRPLTAAALSFAVLSLLAGSVVSFVLAGQARKALAQTQQTMAEGYLRSLNEESEIKPHEVLTLEELASLPAGQERARQLFLEEGTKRAGAARRLDWRLAEASHAAIGLSPRRRARAEKLIRARLGDPDTPPEGRRVLAQLVALLALRDAELVGQAARALLEPGCELTLWRAPPGSGETRIETGVQEETPPFTMREVENCHLAFRRLVGRLDRVQQQALAGMILDLSRKETNVNRLDYLAMLFPALRPSPDEAAQMAQRLITLVQEKEEYLWTLLHAWACVARLQRRDVSREQAARLLKRIQQLQRNDTGALSVGIAKDLLPWLDPAQVEQLWVDGLDRYVRAGEYHQSPIDAPEYYRKHVEYLNPTQARRLARRVLTEMSHKERKGKRGDLSALFWQLCMKVELADTPELLEVMELYFKADDSDLALFLPGLIRLAAHLTKAQLRRLVGQLVRLLDGDWPDGYPLRALAALPLLLDRLSAPEARQVAGWFATRLVADLTTGKELDADRVRSDGYNYSIDLEAILARHHAAIRPWLSEERIRKEERLLWERIRQKPHTMEPRFIRGFVPLLIRVSPADAPEAAMDLVRHCKAGSDLALLAEHLSLEQIVELLRRPTCVGPTREVLLAEMSRRTGRKFADLWQLVDYLRKHATHIDLDAPAPRAGGTALD